MGYHELRKKYPKWAHRRDYHKKKRRRSRSRKRKRRRRASTSTSALPMSLMNQMVAANRPVSRKHGENVVTGYGGGARPDRLAPVRARDEYVEAMRAAAVRDERAAVEATGRAAVFAAAGGP